MQSAQTRQKRFEADGTQLFIPPSVPPGMVRSSVACSHWVDGVSRLRLLAKDRPGSGLLVAHWAENDAYPYLAHSQSETLRDHIWNGIPFQRNSAHAAYQRVRGECQKQSVVVVKTKMGIVVVVLSDVKILSIK